jgi:transposase
MMYDCATDSLLFEHWFEYHFLPNIPAGSYCILDNASFHRRSKLKELTQKVDCHIIFLPPYSPDLNPIEKFWANLKNRLRKVLPHHSGFDEALLHCFRVE